MFIAGLMYWIAIVFLYRYVCFVSTNLSLIDMDDFVSTHLKKIRKFPPFMSNTPKCTETIDINRKNYQNLCIVFVKLNFAFCTNYAQDV